MNFLEELLRPIEKTLDYLIESGWIYVIIPGIIGIGIYFVFFYQ